MNNLFDFVCGFNWAITQEALEGVLSVVNRDYDAEALAKVMHGDPSKFLDEEGNFKSAIEREEGMAVPETRYLRMRGEVAVLSINGPIFPRANLMTEYSGAVSLSRLSTEFNEALESSSVGAIVLDIDSPGGVTTGVSEFADMIRNREIDKPVYAYASGLMASAAYWIGSAADKIITSKSSMLGSIGTIISFVDTRKRDEARGVQNISIVSSQSPSKNADPTTEAGRADIQRTVDALTEVFISQVAGFRGYSVDKVKSDFGRGGVVVGQEAVDRGMADQVGSFESALSEISGTNNQFTGANQMPMQANGEATFTMSYEAVKDCPEVFSKIFDEGKDEGAKCERERIQSIEAIKAKAPGYESVVDEYKYKQDATKESVAVAILEAQASRLENAAESLKEDAQACADQTNGLDNVDADAAAKLKEQEELDKAASAIARGGSK